MELPDFITIGHRGARGLLPENTIPSMIRAVEDGAEMLEMDIQFTGDGKVIVAHDPYVNSKFTLDKYGNELPDKPSYFSQMPYAAIEQYDVGSKFHAGFPKQEKVKVSIPTLKNLITAVEDFTTREQREPVFYTIEIKSDPKTDLTYHPEPEQLVAQVAAVLEKLKVADRCCLQSFDVRQIQEVRRSFPEISIAYLTADGSKSLAEHLMLADCHPDIFSPAFKILTPGLVAQAQEHGMKVIPWTVNKRKDMEYLLSINVDGIITDYPGRLTQILKQGLQ
ncbi:glycerophosphodiester phosphodiesterase family protein [Nonlabens marinus]|uniref:Glycerophosphoryl diester phosphodiesterase n=1 Tax=Nonlabens marinus S1-08 TaxID=1454201 RepID=W8VQJ6_9FLAO|nr:glycerophosphodiester phosphodiesterase family protein [Nonlabens marinus]BAO55120.1 glycerophosphoryl diester phosphodiesterase [Nonlabens marinus S1-08]